MITVQGARRFAGGPLFSLLALLVSLCLGVQAQDLKTVKSPDGKLEFRIFVASQEDTALFRLAYQLWYQGQMLLDTSFMGFDIWEQEPLLGENVGLIGSSNESQASWNGFSGRYMQNGSLGRALEVETRVYNDGVAFRYHLMRSMPMSDLYLSEETTEFAIGGPLPAETSLPLRTERAGAGWMEITEIPRQGFPKMNLARVTDTVLVSRLSRELGNARYVMAGKTPMTGPWRIVGVSSTRDSLSTKGIQADLRRTMPQ